MAVLKVRKRLVKKSFTQYTNTLNEMNYNPGIAEKQKPNKDIFGYSSKVWL